MQLSLSTTPFGRRPDLLAQTQAQIVANECAPDALVRKWLVYDDTGVAMAAIRLSDRTVAVLKALLSFHQPDTLAGDKPIVVFPSNREMAPGASGLAENTLRRQPATPATHARKGQGGEIADAFGFINDRPRPAADDCNSLPRRSQANKTTDRRMAAQKPLAVRAERAGGRDVGLCLPNISQNKSNAPIGVRVTTPDSHCAPGVDLRWASPMRLGVLSGWQQQWSFDVSFPARPAPSGNALSPPIPAKQFFAASTCCAEA